MKTLENKEIGQKIYNLRKQRNLSQDKLARNIGITRPTLQMIEEGKRDLKVAELVKICDELQVPPGMLYGSIDTNNQNLHLFFTPFQRVLVRDYPYGSKPDEWKCDIFSHIVEADSIRGWNYACIGCTWYECIPYNENTKHLLGTTNNPK